ncbi:MAG TPA: DUF1491 family protein [Rhodospirillaceae bacterium]|nr:DUF1491 family protein [Rhodospirillaceae bacterium]
MSEPRLKAKIWAQALLRAAAAQGMMATLLRKGDEDAGTVLIKQNLQGTGFRVLTPIRDGDGGKAWLPGTGPLPVEDPVAEAYILRQIERDRDLWILEIEDREGRLPMGEKIL